MMVDGVDGGSTLGSCGGKVQRGFSAIGADLDHGTAVGVLHYRVTKGKSLLRRHESGNILGETQQFFRIGETPKIESRH